MKKLLILGGTTEARELAHALEDRYAGTVDLTTSLAGATVSRAKLPGKVRIGGFGGAVGLGTYLKENAIDLLIDATHPFAEIITANAAQAAQVAQVPRLRLERAAWTMPDGLDSIFVPDMKEAAAIVARTSKRAFLTIGSKDLGAFAQIPNVHFLIRMIEAPKNPLVLEDHEVLVARPPFSVTDEAKLMRKHDIDTLVTKASGGDATFAKVEAAARVQARAILVRRPPPPEGAVGWSIAAALAWVLEN